MLQKEIVSGDLASVTALAKRQKALHEPCDGHGLMAFTIASTISLGLRFERWDKKHEKSRSIVEDVIKTLAHCHLADKMRLHVACDSRK